jgi:hypothetical protein
MSASETSQSILDIKSWFSRASSRKRISFDGASSADIQRLEKGIDTRVPTSLSILLGECDGGLYFMDKKQLSIAEIIDAVSSNESSPGWRPGFIPFGGDGSSYLVIDTTDDDAVFEWDADDGLGDRLEINFTRYLENYRNSLLEGHFEFLDDVGVIEKVAKHHK